MYYFSQFENIEGIPVVGSPPILVCTHRVWVDGISIKVFLLAQGSMISLTFFDTFDAFVGRPEMAAIKIKVQLFPHIILLAYK